jgi:hypothetical protein
MKDTRPDNPTLIEIFRRMTLLKANDDRFLKVVEALMAV